MTARLPLSVSSGLIQQLKVGTDILDGGDTFNFLAGGRLTLTTGTPVTTSDTTSATPTIYYTPYIHDRITLYTGSNWQTFQFSELSNSALTGATAGQTWDAFVIYNSGTPALSFTLWSNSTTRGTNDLTRLNGVLVSTTDNTRRYVGTVYFWTNNTLSDADAQRGVWNCYNRVKRRMTKTNSTSHTYGTTSWREWNNGSAELMQFVTGLNEDAVDVSLLASMSFPAVAQPYTAYTGVNLDSTSATPALNGGQESTPTTSQVKSFSIGSAMTFPTSTISTIGNHYFAAMEEGGSASSATVTFSSYTMTAMLPM